MKNPVNHIITGFLVSFDTRKVESERITLVVHFHSNPATTTGCTCSPGVFNNKIRKSKLDGFLMFQITIQL